MGVRHLSLFTQCRLGPSPSPLACLCLTACFPFFRSETYVKYRCNATGTVFVFLLPQQTACLCLLCVTCLYFYMFLPQSSVFILLVYLCFFVLIYCNTHSADYLAAIHGKRTVPSRVCRAVYRDVIHGVTRRC